jgi:hypothetical protein
MLITTNLDKDMKDLVGKNVKTNEGVLVGEVIFYDASTGKTIINVADEYWNKVGSNPNPEISSRGDN